MTRLLMRVLMLTVVKTLFIQDGEVLTRLYDHFKAQCFVLLLNHISFN